MNKIHRTSGERLYLTTTPSNRREAQRIRPVERHASVSKGKCGQVSCCEWGKLQSVDFHPGLVETQSPVVRAWRSCAHASLRPCCPLTICSFHWGVPLLQMAAASPVPEDPNGPATLTTRTSAGHERRKPVLGSEYSDQVGPRRSCTERRSAEAAAVC